MNITSCRQLLQSRIRIKPGRKDYRNIYSKTSGNHPGLRAGRNDGSGTSGSLERPFSTTATLNLEKESKTVLTLAVPPLVKYFQRTTPKLERAEAQEFLHPLLERGWRVEDVSLGEGEAGTPHLCGELTLKNATRTRMAMLEVIKLMEEEKHDISWSVALKARPVLSVKMQTHSARKFPATPGQSDETQANVTLRDVRFAILLENMLIERGSLYDDGRK